MLEEQEPIRFLLKIHNFYGVWNLKSLPRWHQVIAVTAFIPLQVISTLLILLSITQAENVADLALSISFSCTYLMALGSIVPYLWRMEMFKDLLSDLNETLREHPDVNYFVKSALDFWRRYERKKVFAFAVSIFIGFFASVATGEQLLPMWLPEVIRDSPHRFLLVSLYQIPMQLYAPFTGFIAHDMLYGLLSIIRAYAMFCSHELKLLVLSEADGKKKLIEAVKIHRNLQRLMRKFVAVAAFPVGSFLISSAYIMCTLVFVLNTSDENNQFGYLVTLTASIFLQLLQPCFYAQAVESASEQFSNDLMESDWTEAELKTKKLLVILMQNLSRPVLKFNLFGIVDVNLNTFLRILNAAYSTYAVLNNMN